MRQKLTRIGISVHPDILKNMEEVADKRGFPSVSEMIRNVFLNYYENEFRSKYFGYQSGLETSSRRLKNQDARTELELQLDRFDTMEDEELTKYIHDCGYITEEEQKERTWFVGVDEEGYSGLFYSYKNSPGSKSLAYDMPKLKIELKKHFKKMKRNETEQ
jgi:hypothetical protein